MATASLSSIFSLFKDQVPNYTLKYLPEITKASKEGAEYIQKLIDLAKLKGKNLNQEKNIYTYLYKLGKVVYDENLSSNNRAVKEYVLKVKNAEKEKEKNNEKIKSLEAALKKALPDIKWPKFGKDKKKAKKSAKKIAKKSAKKASTSKKKKSKR